MRRSTIGLSLTTLLMAGISCNGDEIAGPAELASAPEVGATQAVHSSLRFIQVSAGTGNYGAHSCGVTTAHRIYCWGSNSSGELGNGKFGFEVRPVRVAAEIWFSSVSAGFFHTCGVALDGRAYCWGEGATGALGNGRAGSRPDELPTDRRNKPTLVAGGLRFLRVAAGHSHTCGLTTANRMYCWGDNSHGQLGDGTTTRRLSPKLVTGGRRFRSITVAVGHSCAVTTEYQAFCWGSGGNGRLGNGSTRSSLRPVAVATWRKFRQISAGYFHTCAMGRDNRAYCWGEGISIGDGAGLERLLPTAVAGGRLVEHVEAGAGHTCGNGYDGQGYCWGANSLGELGIGSAGPVRLIPDAFVARRPEVLGYKQLSAGDVHSCGIANTGKAYCWGFNGSGQLGDGTLEWSPTPNVVADPL